MNSIWPDLEGRSQSPVDGKTADQSQMDGNTANQSQVDSNTDDQSQADGNTANQAQEDSKDSTLAWEVGLRMSHVLPCAQWNLFRDEMATRGCLFGTSYPQLSQISISKNEGIWLEHLFSE